MIDLSALTAAIEAGDRTTATSVTKAAIDEGIDPRTILGAMTAAMEVVGGRFQRNEIYVPEMLISARAMKESTPSSSRSSSGPASGRSTPPSSAPSRAISTTSARTLSG
jgi:methanogenic corrinoid protein MtbC1